MLLKLGLVGHDVIVGTNEILLKFIVEGLATDLNANAQHDLDVDDLLLQSGLKDAQVALARLFDRIVLLVLRGHNFIQMDLVVQKVIVVEAFERLEHLFDLAAKVLDEALVFDSKDVLGKTSRFLRHSLLLLVKYGDKDRAFVVLGLHFLRLEVDNLSQLIHTVTACQHLAKNLTRYLLQLMLKRLLRHVRGLQILIVSIRFVAQLGKPWSAIVLTLLLEELGVGHERVVLDCSAATFLHIVACCSRWQLLLAVS